MYSIVVIATAKHIINDFNSLKISENSGLLIRGVVKTAQEALELNPDVIICPVKSETVDGTGLTENVKQNMNTKILLYGRKTYESVKLAFDCGADGYLALPAEKNELDLLLERMKKQMDKNKENLTKNVYLDTSERRNEFFTDILSDNITESEAYERYFELGIDIPYERLAVSFIKIHIKDLDGYIKTNWKYGKDSLFTAVNNFIEKSNSKIYSVILNYGEEELYTVMLTENDGVSKYQLENIRKTLNEIMALDISYEFVALYSSVEKFVKEGSKKEIYDAFGISDEVLTDIGASVESEKAIYKAKEYIARRYMSEIGLNDVAEKVGLSAAYFSRLFKQETGENFIDYLIKVRMEKAKKLFEETTAQAKEIGEKVGYKKGKYFGKLFKNYTGYTPTEYRARLHRKK